MIVMWKRWMGCATAAALLLGGGCAPHATMRGAVVMRVSDHEAHICMGNDEVKAGDRLAIYQHACTAKGAGKSAGVLDICRKQRIGTAEVVRTLNEHYSVIRVPLGVAFQEGTIVEKLVR